MPIDITMPRLSDTMESGTIIKWNVKEGDDVSAGDVIADVETDKATMEMQVYDDGTIEKLAVKEGQKVNVGTVIAVLAGEGGSGGKRDDGERKRPKDDTGESASARQQDEDADVKPAASSGAKRKPTQPEPEEEGGEPEAETEQDEEAPPAKPRRKAAEKLSDAESGDGAEDEAAEASSRRADGRVRVSPVARRLADEHRIDVRAIEGSGPAGRVIKRDVLQAIESADETAASVPPAARRKTDADEVREPAGDRQLATRVKSDKTDAGAKPLAPVRLEQRTIPLSNMRQTIARRLVESKTTIPHYQVTCTFNMDPLLELRTMLNEQLSGQGVKLSVNDFLVRCCALAMYEHPEFNASWAEDAIEVHGEVNVGIAISLPREKGGGLVVATIRNADQKSLRMISYESKVLAEKARTRGLSIQEMSDSTFTLSNLGMFGVDNFTAIINPPNSAILAVGAALKKPVVRDDELTIGHEMSATLSCDHRIIDGAMAAEYLGTLKELIENPAAVMV